MKKNKFIDWGNSEPCPFCNKDFDKPDNDHLFSEHKDVVMEILF